MGVSARAGRLGAEEGALGVQTFPPEQLLLGREELVVAQLGAGIAQRVHPLERCGEARFTYCTAPRTIPISYIPQRRALRDHLLFSLGAKRAGGREHVSLSLSLSQWGDAGRAQVGRTPRRWRHATDAPEIATRAAPIIAASRISPHGIMIGRHFSILPSHFLSECSGRCIDSCAHVTPLFAALSGSKIQISALEIRI